MEEQNEFSQIEKIQYNKGTDEQSKGTNDHTEEGNPRSTSTDSLLKLKPLPKIDLKETKGRKKIEEEDESESESDGIPEAEKKFKQLSVMREMARKVQEEWGNSVKRKEK
ncbi:hypothetical protein Tco_0397784 [Tanacetum coccineum]